MNFSVWRVLKAVLASVSIAIALSLSVSTPAQAHSGSHWWPSDGCTNTPEYWFHHPCVHHDGCYGYHWSDRATCDLWFRNDMIAVCQTLPFDLVATCAGQAYAYYWGVRALGESYYSNPSVAVRYSVHVA